VSRASRVEGTAAVDHRAVLQHVGTSPPIEEPTSQARATRLPTALPAWRVVGDGVSGWPAGKPPMAAS